MSLPVRSLGKPKNRAAYLRFTLKQNWQQLVFYGIVMLLTWVIPSVIGTVTVIQERNFYDTLSRYGGELFRGIAVAFVIVSCVLGIFSGMSATGYVNSRRAIHCYHSLPLTRDTLYLEGSAVQGIYYLVSAFVSILIGILWIISQLGMSGDYVREGFLLIPVGIGGYLLVFSLFQLSGALTGTAVFRFITAGIISFLPVLVYLMIFFGADTGMTNILVDYYINFDHIRFLCPAFNIYCTMAMALGETLRSGETLTMGSTIWSIATLYITAGLYYLLGLWLHRKRRSELSESSLIWKKLIVLVKYPVIFTCGAGCAIFFYTALGSGGGWMFFGGFCGLVLSFLLMNVLISRNTKRMFSGLPGLGITAVVVGLFMAVFPFDILDLNHFMYDTDRVKSVTVMYQGKELEFTEAEQIAALMPYITDMTKNTTGGAYTPEDEAFINGTAYYIDPDSVLNQSAKEAANRLSMQYPDRGVLLDADDEMPVFFWMSGSLLGDEYEKWAAVDEVYGYYEETTAASVTSYYDPNYKIADQYGGDYSYNRTRLEVSVYPKFGLPVHRYIRIADVSENAALFDVLQNTAQYMDSYAALAELDGSTYYSIYVNLMGEGVNLYSGNNLAERYNDEKTRAAAAEYQKLLDNLLEAASYVTPEVLKTPVLGTIEVYCDGKNYSFNLHAGMTAFWDAWLKHWEQLKNFVNQPDIKLDFNKNFLNYYDMLRYTGYSLYENGGEILDWAADFHTDTYIIEANTGRALYVEDDRMAAVLKSGMLTRDGYSDGLRDTRYMVVSRVYTTEAVKEGIEKTLTDGGIPSGYNTFFFFRSNAVPQFVLDAFGGN